MKIKNSETEDTTGGMLIDCILIGAALAWIIIIGVVAYQGA